MPTCIFVHTYLTPYLYYSLADLICKITVEALKSFCISYLIKLSTLSTYYQAPDPVRSNSSRYRFSGPPQPLHQLDFSESLSSLSSLLKPIYYLSIVNRVKICIQWPWVSYLPIEFVLTVWRVISKSQNTYGISYRMRAASHAIGQSVESAATPDGNLSGKPSSMWWAWQRNDSNIRVTAMNRWVQRCFIVAM